MFYASDYSPECPLRIGFCPIWERYTAARQPVDLRRVTLGQMSMGEVLSKSCALNGSNRPAASCVSTR